VKQRKPFTLSLNVNPLPSEDHLDRDMECVMADKNMIENFSAAELSRLRNELMQSGIDSWQAAELVTSFLTAHGYGVNADLVPDVLLRLEGTACSVECIQAELARVALVM
jgi:hypothetical protein